MTTPTGASAAQPAAELTVPAPVSRWEAFRYWLKLGFISFGGPAGQIAMMHTELVERRRWISEHRFLHALNYTMVLPGPEAQQLATYIGWLMHGTLGGIVAGVLFVLPSLFILIGLTWIYLAARGDRNCGICRLPHRFAGTPQRGALGNSRGGVRCHFRPARAISLYRIGGGDDRFTRRAHGAPQVQDWRGTWCGR